MQHLKKFVKTLTSDDNYSLPDRENLMPHIQMPLSRKQKTFFQFVCPFLKPTLYFGHFQNNDDPYS